ncbi:pirin family protein [Aliiglaciecola sp. LCG003]|uniref:pirin family protein n=1 Tax=Aliiglaciecola sp. LCG003 TaxID=3053655 RepID=UPI0025737DC3|nr:pirin family protein [Aliiglaciecola sp. LCG003]WJG09103.1 pirin family protein [Aliiglaciecola sp. LCG003]
MQSRMIKQVVNGIAAQDGAGVKLKRVLGQPALRNLDPFLMLDEFGSDNPNDYLAGFPPHPHRGFQTVTYMLDGKMQHQDSVGNKGLIEKGGIQWMNAGKGIIHEEMPQHSEVAMRGFQLWVNLPANEKMSEPNYQDIPASDVPIVNVGRSEVKVLAGSFANHTGPVSTQAVEPIFLDIKLHGEEPLDIPIPAGHNSFIYCYEGEINIQADTLKKSQLGVLTDGETVTISSHAESRCIVVAGAPINEAIVQYGPFVMNTEEEIRQAMKDYQSGKFA